MLKGLKKVTFSIFIMISIFTLFGAMAFADEVAVITVDEKLASEIDKTNDYVFKTIEKTVEKADKEVLKADGGLDIEETIDKLCEKLIDKTDEKVAKLIEKANKVDVEIVQEYIEVEIYDRTILVDPCCAH